MSRLWVMFDTATKVDYYSDVHTMLAYPQGYYYKYEYRKEYVSQNAITILANEDVVGQEGLIVYCQDQNFKKGEENQKPINSDNFKWIAMRLIKMKKIFFDGENYHLYFEVLDYPKITETELLKLLDSLIQNSEIPFNKYVSVIDNCTISLRYNNDDAWKNIVDSFDDISIQYRGDAFYRIKSIVTKSGNPVEFSYVEKDDRILPRIEVVEGDVITFDIESHEPRESVDHKGFSKSIEIHNDGTDNIKVIGKQKLKLRQYDMLSINLQISGYQQYNDKQSCVSLNSSRINGEWPNGAELDLDFYIKKNWLKAVTQLILYMASVSLYIFNTFVLTETDKVEKMILTIILAVVIIISQAISTGKITTIYK